MKILSNNKIET